MVFSFQSSMSSPVCLFLKRALPRIVGGQSGYYSELPSHTLNRRDRILEASLVDQKKLTVRVNQMS